MKTNKQAMSFEAIAKMVARRVDDQAIFSQIEMKRMKNDSVSVKYKGRNKRICRIDTAYDQVRFTTDRVSMFNGLNGVAEHAKTNCRVYATLLVPKEDVDYTLYKICQNACLLAEEDE